MLNAHLLAPLFLEYESQIRLLNREVKQKSSETSRLAEELKLMVKENEDMHSRLEVQQREYLKLVEETRDNADLLALRTGSLKANEGGSVSH